VLVGSYINSVRNRPGRAGLQAFGPVENPWRYEFTYGILIIAVIFSLVLFELVTIVGGNIIP
jgi:hypothetical protein